MKNSKKLVTKCWVIIRWIYLTICTISMIWSFLELTKQLKLSEILLAHMLWDLCSEHFWIAKMNFKSNIHYFSSYSALKLSKIRKLWAKLSVFFWNPNSKEKRYKIFWKNKKYIFHWCIKFSSTLRNFIGIGIELMLLVIASKFSNKFSNFKCSIRRKIMNPIHNLLSKFGEYRSLSISTFSRIKRFQERKNRMVKPLMNNK